MKKKIFVFGFIGLFAISTIGLPLTIHFCEMMNKSSIVECAICAEEIDTPSCCEVESDVLRFSSLAPNCCQEDFTFNKIEDDFINSKSEIKFIIDCSFHFDANLYLSFSNNLSNEKYLNSDLPPPGAELKPIYLLNSTFLI